MIESRNCYLYYLSDMSWDLDPTLARDSYFQGWNKRHVASDTDSSGISPGTRPHHVKKTNSRLSLRLTPTRSRSEHDGAPSRITIGLVASNLSTIPDSQRNSKAIAGQNESRRSTRTTEGSFAGETQGKASRASSTKSSVRKLARTLGLHTDVGDHNAIGDRAAPREARPGHRWSRNASGGIWFEERLVLLRKSRASKGTNISSGSSLGSKILPFMHSSHVQVAPPSPITPLPLLYPGRSPLKDLYSPTPSRWKDHSQS